MPKIINRTALTQKSQITLPKQVREILKVKPGDQVSFEIEGRKIKIIPLPSSLEENFGKVRPKRKPENFKKIRKEFGKKVGEEVTNEY